MSTSFYTSLNHFNFYSQTLSEDQLVRWFYVRSYCGFLFIKCVITVQLDSTVAKVHNEFPNALYYVLYT